MATEQCLSYIDFLGESACNFTSRFGKGYTNYISVYAISAARQSVDKTLIDESIIDKITATPLTSFTWDGIANNIRFAESSSGKYMCYHFKNTNINTESDNEPDAPYSYEELFNENALTNMNSSTAMQYKYIYSAYNTMTPKPITVGSMTSTQELALNNFKTTNNLVSDKDFVRSDYYKFFVPETNVIHDRSMLELNDDYASVGNRSHDSFNCLLYCINPCFDDKISYDVRANKLPPSGFDTHDAFCAIPISICTFSKDIVLAGNNVQFEPNLNGIVTVE